MERFLKGIIVGIGGIAPGLSGSILLIIFGLYRKTLDTLGNLFRDFKNNLRFLRCACHFTENCSSLREDGTSVSKRAETKELIKLLRKTNPYVEANLFKSAENVNLDRVIGWKKNLTAHTFLEDYEG